MNTSEIAGELLRRLGTSASENEIGMLFSLDTEWNIPGDANAFPWIGKKKGRDVVESFVRDTRRLLQPLGFVVDGIISDERRAVILGSLASRVRATGKTIETAFAIIMTVAGGEITSFSMLEDSFAVSMSARK